MTHRLDQALASALAAMALSSCAQESCVVTEQPFGVSESDALRLADRDAGTGDDATPCQAACARAIGATFRCAVPALLSCSGAGGDARAGAPFVCQVRLTTCSTPGGAICGRRPEGWRDTVLAAGDPVAAWWSRQMRLEHASIAAFARLADELSAHRAPRALVALARRARRDEVRHTRAMAAFVRRAGAPVRRGSAPSAAPARPLVAMAEENAVEGCVREAFGALVAAWQARHARDPRARAAFGAVAGDEARHAGLAWRVHGWASARLSREERARLDGAMVAAVAALAAELTGEADPALRAAGLWPDLRALRAGLAALTRGLLSDSGRA